jgi:hypothetical protein
MRRDQYVNGERLIASDRLPADVDDLLVGGDLPDTGDALGSSGSARDQRHGLIDSGHARLADG